MHFFFKFLNKNTLIFRQISINVIGIAGGQAILFFSTPLLTRIYSTEAFGLYASLLAVASVAVMFATLRFDVAIPVVQDKDVGRILCLAVLASFIISCFFQLLIKFAGISNLIRSAASFDIVGAAIWVAMFQGILSSVQYILIRRSNFFVSNMLRIAQPIIFLIIGLLNLVSLSVAVFLSVAITSIFGLFLIRSDLCLCRPIEIILLMKKFWQYPVISMPFSAMDAASVAFPLLFITLYYGADNAGQYSQIQRIVGAPLLLFGAAVGHVFFSYAAKNHRMNNTFDSFFYKIIWSMSFLGLGTVLLLFFFGDELVKYFFGEGWRSDFPFLFMALFPVITKSIVSPVSTIFLIKNKIFLISLWQFGYFSLILFLLNYSLDKLSFEEFLIHLILCDALGYLVYLSLAFVVLKIK